MKLLIATSQFPISADIRSNTRHIKRHLAAAKQRGAHVVHYPEAALSGYAGSDFESHTGFDWTLLRDSAEEVFDYCGRLGIWMVLGSAHPLTGKHKPHNSLYIVNDKGKLVDRYDKLFCAGNREGTVGDLAHYSSGDHFCVFNIHGVRCGTLICHDFRYPELYREYKRLGVQLMFHSYHAGNLSSKRLRQLQNDIGRENFKFNRGKTYPEITMSASMQGAAASSHIWISCSNTSARESCWAGYFVRADGVITGRLRQNISGILLSEVDSEAHIYESTAAWRDNALKGIFHSGEQVKDKRSKDRKTL